MVNALHVTAPVRWDLSKADDGTGSLTGWASVYGVIDQQSDVIAAGAFGEFVKSWKASGRPTIPLAVDHDHSSDGIIGSITDLTDSPYGLSFTAAFSSDPRAQSYRLKAAEGHLTGVSVFADIQAKSMEMVGARAVRVITKAGPLREVSLTGYPVNTSARVTVAKAATMKGTTMYTNMSAAELSAVLDRMDAELFASMQASAVKSMTIDEIFAEERRRGYTGPGPGRLPGGTYDRSGQLVCGECTPCREGRRGDCIHKGTQAAVNAAIRHRRVRENQQASDLLAEVGRASGFAAVADLSEHTVREAAKANLHARIDEM